MPSAVALGLTAADLRACVAVRSRSSCASRSAAARRAAAAAASFPQTGKSASTRASTPTSRSCSRSISAGNSTDLSTLWARTTKLQFSWRARPRPWQKLTAWCIGSKRITQLAAGISIPSSATTVAMSPAIRATRREVLVRDEASDFEIPNDGVAGDPAAYKHALRILQERSDEAMMCW
eukprot:CAMPEP_0179997210 /NCGR_PEP_ID=MMETSP0984-20121128/8014_1 /TAXON_ID=483367 /ORGANISM="non described non described, Strain CCMP 2436" /LENGTH=178 /DNA_ID=CAMNT_0021916787 /DNA_START=371 /DNA_END=905 /DNA_ORIENTATION=+